MSDIDFADPDARERMLAEAWRLASDRADAAEAKLAKAREWAEQYHGETFSGPGVDALIAIIDGRDAEKQEK